MSKHLQTKSLCYTVVKNTPRVLLSHSEAKKANLQISILSSFFLLLLLPIHHITQKQRAHMNILHVKQMLYYRRVAFSGLELYVSRNWCVIIQNMYHSRLSRCHFMHTFGHNLQIIGRILAFYVPNNLSTIGDIASWLYSCMHTSTGELRLQTCIAFAFLSDFYG